jgi:exonuclease III
VTYVKEAFSPVEAAADCLPGGGGGGEDDITQEGRVMLTDHGSFVLLNIYAPNAGEKPLKPRLEFKMRFLNALRSKCKYRQKTYSLLLSCALTSLVQAASSSVVTL